MEDYLKVIYALEQNGDGVGTSAIARCLHLAPASVTSMVKRLARLRLAVHARYRDVRLTPSGRQVARAVIRRHRLIRTYLAQRLGASPQVAEREADKLEHAMSSEVVRRIAAILGQAGTTGDGQTAGVELPSPP